jgi:hypothetical protein
VGRYCFLSFKTTFESLSLGSLAALARFTTAVHYECQPAIERSFAQSHRLAFASVALRRRHVVVQDIFPASPESINSEARVEATVKVQDDVVDFDVIYKGTMADATTTNRDDATTTTTRRRATTPTTKTGATTTVTRRRRMRTFSRLTEV